MSRSLLRFAVAAAAVLALTSCGSDEPDGSGAAPESPSSSTASTTGPAATDAPGAPGSSDGEPGETGSGDDDGATVTRAPFCAEMDPGEVGDLLGLNGLDVIGQQEPGQEITPIPGGTPVQAQSWSCTIGRATDSPLGITWNVGAGEAGPKDANAVIASATGSLDPKNCTKLNDDSLGDDTRGADCAGTTEKAGGTGFTLVTRAAVVDGALLECLLASVDPRDLAAFTQAAADVCGMLVDQVVD